MNKDALNKITKARVRLILESPFFGFLGMHLEPRESSLEVPTMGTDGEYLYYDPDFVMKIPLRELQGVICHEVFHCAFGHLWRRGTRDEQRWNVAADGVCNEHLIKQGFFLPGDIIRFEGAGEMSVEELYNKIQVVEKVVGTLVDDHEKWNGCGSKEKGSLSESRWKERASQARQLAKSRGIGMGGLEEELDKLFEPKLPWREMLRNFLLVVVKSNYRLIPPNRRHLWRGLYLPSLYGEELELGFAIDTSGSMSTEDIKEGLSEVRGVCDQFENYKVHLWQCDYGVQDYRELTSYSFDFPQKIRGRGGTAFEPVFEDVAKRNLNIACLVYFTDLMGSFPESAPDYPVIWLTTCEGKVPFGELIRYERDVA
jgi:predicted metal-dependent peptidase